MTFNRMLALRLETFQREREARERLARAASPVELAHARREIREIARARATLDQPLRQCGAKTRAGHPCAKWPVDGSRRCELHGGRTPRGSKSVHFKSGHRQRWPRVNPQALNEACELAARAMEDPSAEHVRAFRLAYARLRGRPAP